MNKHQLASTIWESANQMRSKIEANEYKDFILGFIFYKYLSERELDLFQKEKLSEDEIKKVDCQHFFRQIFLGYFSDIVQAFDTLRKNVCGDDYTSLHNPIVLASVLPAYGMFHSIQILFL